MSRYAKLIINGIEADSFSLEATPLNLKKRISNPDGEPAGSFTRSTIKIPATKNNKSILSGKLGFLPFRIDISGSTRLSGFLQVKKEEIISNCYECIVASYEVALQGGNSDWFLALRNCKLSEITAAKVFFDVGPIDAGFNADPDLIDNGFFFMKFKEWENSRLITENNPFGGSITRQLESPSYKEATPFLFIRPLVIEAFRKVGYTIESDFIESDFFKRLIMPVPLPNKMPQIYSDNYLNFHASKDTLTINNPAVTVFNFPFDTVTLPPLNTGVWNALTYEYIVPSDGFYELETGATFGPEVGMFSFIYLQVATVNGSAVIAGQGGFAEGGLLGLFPFPTNQTKKGSVVAQASAGDIIAVTVQTFTDTPFTILNSYLKINGEAIRALGLNIDFASLVDKYDFLPLLKDLTTIFKLGFDTNADNKKVKIEPLDPYLYTDRLSSTKEVREGYYYLSNTIDYSGKIDFSKKIDNKIPVLDGFFKFFYLSDEDETTKAREENERFKIYEAIYNSPDGSDKNKTKEIKTEFFAKSIHTTDNLARYPDTEINPQFVLSYPFNYVLDPTATNQDANYDISPRILYFGGQRGGIDGYIEINENQGGDVELPAAFMVNYNDVSGLDPNLSFATEIIAGQEVAGIVDRFQIHCLSRKSQRGEKKASVLQTPTERDNFTFRKKAIINGKRYVIESIESVNPLQNTPDKFLFVLDEFADKAIKDGIENSNLSGLFSIFPV
jgi:hypothetical protein